MSDVDAEHVHYPILKAQYDELTEHARATGYTDDEIRHLHERAAEMAAKMGWNHNGCFNLIMTLSKPKITLGEPAFAHPARRRTLWENIRWRVGMWWHRLTHRQRNYRGLSGGQDD